MIGQTIYAKHDDWATTLLGEALLFNLLSRLIYKLPQREWLQSLSNEEVFGESPFGMHQPEVVKGLSLLAQWLNKPGGIDDLAMQDLNDDHIRLFIGIGHVLAPVWESVHLSAEHLIFQQPTLDVRQWYRRFGIEAENLNREPDDHIALEMAFIAYLANLGVQALENGNTGECERLLEAQHEFTSQHLLKWAFLWCQLVIENAHTNFYLGIAWLTRGALIELASLLDLEIREPIP
jgi:TorA maturation chaperone TorD